LNEDFEVDDSDDDDKGQAPQHTQCFLALNSISDDKTKVVLLDEMLQNKELEKAFMESEMSDEQGVDNTVPSCVLVLGAEERKDDPEDIHHSTPRIIVPFVRGKVPVNLDEEFLFAKAFPQQVPTLLLLLPISVFVWFVLAGCCFYNIFSFSTMYHCFTYYHA